MIMAGLNITVGNDSLKKIQEEYFFNSIRHPKIDLASRIKQIRIIYNIDRKQYSAIKKTLPYVVCGIFNPPYRRTDNFAYIDRFIIDIDGLCEKGFSYSELHSKITSDERVMMCFKSPSEDGLKIMFKLSERCYDPAIYSVFYKEFLRQFSSSYNLEQVIDSRTSDVTRACFTSMDENAYYNPDAEPVNLSAYIDSSNTTEFFDLIHQQEMEEINADTAQQQELQDQSKDPDKETMDKIKAILNPKLQKLKEQKDIYVPQEIISIMSALQTYLEEFGIQTTETLSIQYGEKIRMCLGQKAAEINLFYGRKGYTVVISPRNGTDEELNSIAADLIKVFIDENARS